MYSKTSIKWPCSNAETLLRRTDTFDPVCFLYASLSRIYKAIEIYCYSKNRKEDNSSNGRLLFSPQIKKPPALRGNIWKFYEFPRNRWLNRTFLSIFSKRSFYFYTLKQQHFFCLILQFWRSAALLSGTPESFSPSYSLQATNSCFASLKAISGRNLQTMFHSSINYWFYYCDLH